MAYWLMKSEPDVFSIDDLASAGREKWDGIRNYQARNMMRDDMKIGDEILFYHSSCKEPGVTGIARVASAPYADPTQFDRTSKYFDAKSDVKNPRWTQRPAFYGLVISWTLLDVEKPGNGTEGRTRTDKPVKAGDFESPVSTNSTTPAANGGV